MLEVSLFRDFHRDSSSFGGETSEMLEVSLFRDFHRDSSSFGEEDLLWDWIEQGKRFSVGEQLPPSNYEWNPANNQLSMKDEAAHYIRHILFVYNISLTRFPSLMNCFSVLLLRRPLSVHEFSSTNTINYHVF
jgi:hypothetical protein